MSFKGIEEIFKVTLSYVVGCNYIHIEWKPTYCLHAFYCENL